MRNVYILGINAFHADSSACILKNGEIIAAIEEERICRIKHWAGFPGKSIAFCLSEAGISASDLHHVAISRNPRANFLYKMHHALRYGLKISAIIDRVHNQTKIVSVRRLLADAVQIREADIKASFHNVEHHRAHLASAFFASPFHEAAMLSIDGFGDFSSTMLAVGKGIQIDVRKSVRFPHSLGIFYTAFTQYLGFNKYGDEYKVMGLAPYGQSKYMKELENVIFLQKNGLFSLNQEYFRHFREGVQMNWDEGEPFVGSIFSERFPGVFGKPRDKNDPVEPSHMDLAASVQKMTEKVIFHILNHLHKDTRLKNLVIAGGVSQNSVINGKILDNTGFEQLYLPPAAHDAGTSLGAALYVHNIILGQPRQKAIWSGALGSIFDDRTIEACIQANRLTYRKFSESELFEETCDCLINGGVVGWFQGRAEFGPRALGQRSILCDPRRKDAKDILNLKIKRRESFRPFAPSILAEYQAQYFDHDDPVPFMEKVYNIKKEVREIIPAVTHVDGSGRLQTVLKEHNPRYHGLITRFYEKTNVPVLLNTSFNENEPIVNTPEEALQCYLRTKMDMIVLGDYIVRR